MAIIYGIILTLIASFIGSWGVVDIKKTYIKSIKSLPLRGLIVYIGASLITIWALKYGPISLLYPIAATSYIWATIFSKIVIKEKINKYKITGISLIILAVLILSIFG